MKMNDRQVRQGCWLIVGTVFPFLLLFALPLMGLSEGAALTVAKVVLLVFHIVIIVRHASPRGDTQTQIISSTKASDGQGTDFMHQVSVLRFGFALGLGSALAYLGCVVTMAILPRPVAVSFFNSLVHCVDMEPILRWEMSMSEMFLGVVSVFVLGWLFAAVVAGLYNVGAGTWARC